MATHDPQTEQFDARLAEAMHDVPVPAGLAERLRAELQADALRAGASPDLPRSPRSNRRTWLVGTAAGAIACAASVLVAMWLWPQSPAVVGAEEVMHQARAWHQQAREEDGKWDLDASPPSDYPLGSFVVSGQPVGGNVPWRHLASRFYGRRGVAYRLTGPRKVRATLLVIDRRGAVAAPQMAALPGSPLQNALTTDGCTTAAWVEGSRLYVLVVDGGVGDLRALVRELGSMA